MTIPTTTSPRPSGGATATISPASERQRFLAWAGWCGLVASLAYLTTIVATSLLGGVEPYDGPADVARYLGDVGDDAYRSYLYGIAGVAMSILYVPFGIAVHALLRRGAAAAMGTLAMIVGLLMLVPAYVINILEAAALAPAADELGAGAAESLYPLVEAAAMTAGIFFTIGSILTLCLSPLLWVVEARRTGALPTWLTRTGLVVGLSGLVWFVWLLEGPVVLAALLVNVVASLVFFVGLARRLLVDRASD